MDELCDIKAIINGLNVLQVCHLARSKMYSNESFLIKDFVMLFGIFGSLKTKNLSSKINWSWQGIIRSHLIIKSPQQLNI